MNRLSKVIKRKNPVSIEIVSTDFYKWLRNGGFQTDRYKSIGNYIDTYRLNDNRESLAALQGYDLRIIYNFYNVVMVTEQYTLEIATDIYKDYR